MKIFYTVTGTISLVLGIIGIFVPLLPTTPFLLLSAAFYFRGSPRLYRWLIQQKQLGPYIKNFREYRAIPLRAKIISLSLIWITLSYCIFQIAPYLWLKIILLAIAIGTTWHILSYKILIISIPNKGPNVIRIPLVPCIPSRKASISPIIHFPHIFLRDPLSAFQSS